MKIQSHYNHRLVNTIIESLDSEPDLWKIDTSYITHENTDLRIYTQRLKTPPLWLNIITIGIAHAVANEDRKYISDWKAIEISGKPEISDQQKHRLFLAIEDLYKKKFFRVLNAKTEQEFIDNISIDIKNNPEKWSWQENSVNRNNGRKNSLNIISHKEDYFISYFSSFNKDRINYKIKYPKLLEKILMNGLCDKSINDLKDSIKKTQASIA